MEKDVWLRPTEKILAPFVWLEELTGHQNIDRRSLAEQAFIYVLSLPVIEDDDGSVASRALKRAAKSSAPSSVIVGKIPSSLNMRTNEELLEKVKRRFLDVFSDAKNIQMPFLFRVSAIAYAQYLVDENRSLGIYKQSNNEISTCEINNGLDIMKLTYQIQEMFIRNLPKDAEYIEQIRKIIEERMIKDYMQVYPGTPPLSNEGDYRCSVHRGNTYRLEKAEEQVRHSKVSREEIICYVKGFLKSMNMSIDDFEVLKATSDIDYEEIKEQCELKDKRDIVWMKFTKEGYLGVVATSDDINHDIPISSADYDKKIKVYNEYNKNYQYVWKHNSTGILVHQLGKKWDDSFVLVFPLVSIPHGFSRGDIERAIGNMLINKNVPIVDFYSHNY